MAIGLLTERDLSILGEGFRRMFRIEPSLDFDDLLAAIDEAERRHGAKAGQSQVPMPRIR